MAQSTLFQKNTIKELKTAFETGGMEAVIQKAYEELDRWKEIPLKIAVSGTTGVGKSSLINALMGLRATDIGAAKVGVVETTTKVESYTHPDNKNLVFVDLPGAGTQNFPKEKYLENESIGFKNYDVFIIVSATRFTEDEVWLGKEIAKQNKSLVFVRSKIVLDLINEQQSNMIPEKQTINTIRKDCEKIVEVASNAKVFLVDSYATKHPLLDFDGLNSHLKDSVPEWKREAFVLAMTATTTSLITDKNKVLAERMNKIAFISAVGGAIPVPGLSIMIDAIIIVKEVLFYHTQYRIPQSINHIRRLTDMTNEEVFVFLLLSEYSSSMTAAALLSKLPSMILVPSEILEESASFFIPVLGSIVGGALSYGSTRYALSTILAKVTEDALKINKYMLQQTEV